MPRPKRPKVVHTVLPEVRVVVPLITSTAQKQKALLSPQSSDHITNVSDDSDGLVRRNKGWHNAGVGGIEEYTMSGALASEPDGTTRSRPPSRQTRAELTRIVRDADHAKARAEKIKKRHDAYSGQENSITQIPSSLPPTAPPTTRQDSDRVGRSTVISSNRNSVASRLQSTPLAQLSMLGAIQFKKRARQPSLLQLAQAQYDTTADLKDDEDLFDFRPDDESTPLVKSLSQIHQRASSSSAKTSGSRKRKLASPEILVPASQSQSQQDSSSQHPDPFIQQDDSFEYSPEDAEDEPEPTLPRLRQVRTPSPQIFSDTLAPPQSSSSPVKPASPAARRKKPRPINPNHTRARKQRESASSPAASQRPPTTASQATPARKAPPAPKPLTTARLQNLLPRRRTRRKQQDTYDIPSSSDVELDTTQLGEDEDELSFHASTKIRRKKATANNPKRGTGKGVRQNAEMALKGRRISKTYTRKSAVEQPHSEDESTISLNEETIDTGAKKPLLGTKAKAEMQRLAEKFREVDDFTLDFEDMTGGSSQMKDAR